MTGRRSEDSIRADALDIIASHLRSGLPMHPAMYSQLREIIGETTPEEESMLRSYRLAGEAERERSREDMQQLAEASAQFREAMGLG